MTTPSISRPLRGMEQWYMGAKGASSRNIVTWAVVRVRGERVGEIGEEEMIGAHVALQRRHALLRSRTDGKVMEVLKPDASKADVRVVRGNVQDVVENDLKPFDAEKGYMFCLRWVVEEEGDGWLVVGMEHGLGDATSSFVVAKEVLEIIGEGGESTYALSLDTTTISQSKTAALSFFDKTVVIPVANALIVPGQVSSAISALPFPPRRELGEEEYPKVLVEMKSIGGDVLEELHRAAKDEGLRLGSVFTAAIHMASAGIAGKVDFGTPFLSWNMRDKVEPPLAKDSIGHNIVSAALDDQSSIPTPSDTLFSYAKRVQRCIESEIEAKKPELILRVSCDPSFSDTSTRLLTATPPLAGALRFSATSSAGPWPFDSHVGGFRVGPDIFYGNGTSRAGLVVEGFVTSAEKHCNLTTIANECYLSRKTLTTFTNQIQSLLQNPTEITLQHLWDTKEEDGEEGGGGGAGGGGGGE